MFHEKNSPFTCRIKEIMTIYSWTDAFIISCLAWYLAILFWRSYCSCDNSSESFVIRNSQVGFEWVRSSSVTRSQEHFDSEDQFFWISRRFFRSYGPIFKVLRVLIWRFSMILRQFLSLLAFWISALQALRILCLHQTQTKAANISGCWSSSLTMDA